MTLRTLTLHLKAFQKESIQTALEQMETTLEWGPGKTRVKTFLPRRSQNYTVIRGPHVHKKSREQFQWTRYAAMLEGPWQAPHHALKALRYLALVGVQTKLTLKASSYPSKAGQKKRMN